MQRAMKLLLYEPAYISPMHLLNYILDGIMIEVAVYVQNFTIRCVHREEVADGSYMCIMFDLGKSEIVRRSLLTTFENAKQKLYAYISDNGM
jgi:hypothetical protein